MVHFQKKLQSVLWKLQKHHRFYFKSKLFSTTPRPYVHPEGQRDEDKIPKMKFAWENWKSSDWLWNFSCRNTAGEFLSMHFTFYMLYWKMLIEKFSHRSKKVNIFQVNQKFDDKTFSVRFRVSFYAFISILSQVKVCAIKLAFSSEASSCYLQKLENFISYKVKICDWCEQHRDESYL